MVLSSMSAGRETRPRLSDPAGVVSGSTETSGGPLDERVSESARLLLTCFDEITLQSDQRTAQEEAG